jgi:hypothetical protein
LARLVLDPASAAAAVAAAPPRVAWELALLLGVCRSVWELLELLAAGTLAVDMLVFGASLFGRRPPGSGGNSSGDASEDGGETSSSSEGSDNSGLLVEREGGLTTITVSAAQPPAPAPRAPAISGLIRFKSRGAAAPDDASASVLQQLLPRGAWERRALLAVAVVRFVALPAATALLAIALLRAGWLPASDPAVLLALMLPAATPPAQALVTLVQVGGGGDGTASGKSGGSGGLAAACARLLLQLYALAIVPLTLWASVFASIAKNAAAAAAAAAGGVL